MSSSSSASRNSPVSQPGASQTAADDDDDMFSLDFTVPQKSSEPEPPPPPSPPLALVEPSIPAAAPAPVLSCIEQAARLYAGGQADAARALLEPFVRSSESGEMAWGMLLDLYRLAGDQAAFEKLALEYVARFEKSPPSWGESLGGQAVATINERRASVSLTGVLNAHCEPQFAQLVKLAVSRPTLRLDVSKLQDADNGGCVLLLHVLKESKKARHEIVFGSAERLVEMLKNKIVEGRRENESVWLLLLELYQRLGQAEPFEEVALQYAITFEVSPPSWELPKTQTTGAAQKAAAAVAAAEAHYDLQLMGDILDAVPGIAFMDIAEAGSGAAAQEITVDASPLRRIDIASANVLLDTLKSLADAGHRVHIRGTSHLVAALFEAIGMARVAQVATRRF